MAIEDRSLKTSISKRSFVRDGDIILAGLLTIHHKTTDDRCGKIKLQGIAYFEAMIYAIEKINNDSSLLPNLTLGYDIQDYCDSIQLASESAFAINTRNLLFEYLYSSNKSDQRKQIANEIFGAPLKPVAAVIGTADSSSSMVVGSMLQVQNIPQVSPFATSEELTSNKYKTFFRTVPSDRQQAKAIADLIDHFGWTYVTLIGVDSSYGRWGLLSLERESQNRGTFCIHAIEIFPTTRYESKVNAIISRLKKDTRSKVVVLWADPTTSLYVLDEARNQKVIGITWLAPDGWSEASSLFKREFLPVIGGFLGTLFRKFEISEFKKHLMGLTRESRNSSWWREAWEQMDKNCHRDKTNVSNICTNGQYSKVTKQMFNEMYTAYLPYVIDAVYAVAHALDRLFRSKNDVGPLSGGSFANIQHHIHRDLLLYLSNVSFRGLTGMIKFEASGNSEQTAAYTIVNMRPTDKAEPTVRPVGSWTKLNHPRLSLRKQDVYWNNGSISVPQSVCSNICPAGTWQSATLNCCWECYKCSPSSYSNSPGSHNCTECPADQKPNQDYTECENLPVLNLKISESIVILVLCGLGMALLVFVLAVFIRLRHTPLVKAANWELSCVLLFGIALGFVTPSLYVMPRTTLTCCLSEACSSMYFVVCVSVLFLKTNRLIHVFDVKVISSSLTKWIYRGTHQLILIILLNVIPILSFSVWIILDTPTAYREISPLYAIYYECQWFSETIGFSMHLIIFVYSILLSIVCTLYAFRARKLPSNFNEAQYIGFAMYIQLMCLVTIFGLHDNLSGSQGVLSHSGVILVSTFGFLFCMFAPKLYVIFRHPERNTAEYIKSDVSTHNLMRQIKIHHGKPTPHWPQNTSVAIPKSSEGDKPQSIHDRKKLKFLNRRHREKYEIKQSENRNMEPKGTTVAGDSEMKNFKNSSALTESSEVANHSPKLKQDKDTESKLSIDSTFTEIFEI